MAKKERLTSEETIAKAWKRYNEMINEQIDKAKAQGKDIGWQFERLETYDEFRSAYMYQQSSNRYYAAKGKKKAYKGKENITRQLVKWSHIWTRSVISRYAKEIDATSMEAAYDLSKKSRQELFDTFLELSGNNYDVAAASYRSIVYGGNPSKVSALHYGSSKVGEQND